LAGFSSELGIKKKLKTSKSSFKKGWFSCLAFFLVAGQAVASSWHVDASATGNNSGKNWTDAWTNLVSIAWPNVKPGDTIFISRGSYPEPLLVGVSGTSNAPITISLRRDSQFGGAVNVRGINIGRHEWITIDGALDKTFSPPTNILQLRTITNNVGLFCSNSNGTAIYMTNPNGIKLLWVGVEQARRGVTKAANGIWANVTRRGATDHNQVKYCWIKDVDDDGIAWIGNAPATHFGHQEIAFSIIERVGDDGLEANHGFTVHDCIIGPSLFLNGHPDGIQSVGSFWKIYNNEFHDFFNSWIRTQATQVNHHDVWIYNNLFLSGRYVDPKISIYNTGIEVVQYAAHLGEVESMTWDQIVICNNTFYNAPRLVGGTINWAKRDEKTKDAFVHNVTVTNSLFVNNLVVDCGRGVSAWWQELKSAPPWGSAIHYSEQGLRWDYNTVTGNEAPEARRIGYHGNLFKSAEAMNKASTWKNNSSAPVKFADPAQWNFELALDDKSARNTGASLAEFFAHDILNRPRVEPWSRGAFESPR